MRDGGEAHGGNGGGRCRFRVMQPLCSRSSLSIYPYLQMPVCDYWHWLRRSLRPGGVPKQSRHPALILDLAARFSSVSTGAQQLRQ